MSFRITGYGSRQQQERRNRATAFKRTHKVGQICRGILTRWQNAPYGWVTVDGHEMLAELQTTPQIGQSLTFLVIQLEPQIVLKELKDGDAPPVTINDILRSYWTARDRLDAHLQSFCWPELQHLLSSHAVSQQNKNPQDDDNTGFRTSSDTSKQTPPIPSASQSQPQWLKNTLHKHFAEHIATNEEACLLYLQFIKAKFGVDMLLADTPYRLHYVPWWEPRARAVELLATHGEKSAEAPPVKLTMGANYPYAGRILCQMLLHETGQQEAAATVSQQQGESTDAFTTLGYRLYVEHSHIVAPCEAVCRAFDNIPLRSPEPDGDHPDSGSTQSQVKSAALDESSPAGKNSISRTQRDRNHIVLSCLGVSQLPAGIHDVLSSILSGGSSTYSRYSGTTSLNRKA